MRRTQPIVLGILIAMAGIFLSADSPSAPEVQPESTSISASERLAELSVELEKTANELKTIVDETRGGVRLNSSRPADSLLPRQIVFRHWKTSYCKICDDWKRDELSKVEALGIKVVPDDTLDEDCEAPQFKLCWCGPNCDCLEDCSNCTRCEVYSGYLTIAKIHEIAERLKPDPKKQPTPAQQPLLASQLKTASSLAEAKLTGAQLVLGPGLHVERLKTVNGQAVESPLVVTVQPPAGVRIPMDDACKVVYASSGSTGSASAGSSGQVSYQQSTWVNAPSYPVRRYVAPVVRQPTVYYQSAPVYQPRRTCRWVNGVQVCN